MVNAQLFVFIYFCAAQRAAFYFHAYCRARLHQANRPAEPVIHSKAVHDHKSCIYKASTGLLLELSTAFPRFIPTIPPAFLQETLHMVLTTTFSHTMLCFRDALPLLAVFHRQQFRQGPEARAPYTSKTYRYLQAISGDLIHANR